MIVLSPLFISAQNYFTPNEGQWEGDFLYRSTFGNTTFYIANDHLGFTQVTYEGERHGDHVHGPISQGHHYRMKFINANQPNVEGSVEAPHYENYFLGKERNWRTEVHPVEEVLLSELYDGVDMRIYTRYGQLKYDLLSSSADHINQVAFYYDGVEDIRIIDGRLHVYTSVGENIEIRPYVYNPESKKAIDAAYSLSGDTLRFVIDEDYHGPVVVDPTFIFSTFTGSTKDNWGYSATFDPLDSSVYVAGIVRLAMGNYPTTTGAFDTTFNGSVDVSITKFSSDGKTLLYSTYLGGGSIEQPSSIIADTLGQLVVMGSTGSVNFPTTQNAYDTVFNAGASAAVNIFTYPQGVDMFVTVFNASGTGLIGSTYAGGTGSDAVNLNMAINYGDEVRGEVIISPWNTILIATSTTSTDIPLVRTSATGISGKQDGWLVELPMDCSDLLWSTPFGGTEDDAGLAIRVSEVTGDIYVAGGTESATLPNTTNGAFPSAFVGRDGYISVIDSASRAPINTTFNGTSSFDMNFLMDLDRNGNVYVFGQTRGQYPTSPNAINQLNHSLFVHEFDPSLGSSMRSMAFGNGFSNSLALSPTAFLVDRCGDVYISGWGGSTNSVSSSTRNMFVTNDAFQDTTDGSDLYFAVIDAGFQRYNYATFFGGLGPAEHVDGGTSRFDDRGVMYQAICAGCPGSSNYPTFPTDVHSRDNGSTNCNLAVTVISFDQQNADVELAVPDTVCAPFDLFVIDTIVGADIVIWDFGNGDIDTSFAVPQRLYTAPGTYTIRVIGLDTNCFSSDTATVTFEVVNPAADAAFGLNYDPCDPNLTVSLVTANQNSAYFWDFGDGTTDTTTGNTTHVFPSVGEFTITVIARATNCFGTVYDTSSATVVFYPPPADPTIDFLYDGCANAGEARFSTSTPNWHIFEWTLSNGDTYSGNYVITTLPTGFITITLRVTDTLCNRTAVVTETFEAQDISVAFGGRVPNVFSPDGDGINDYFQLQEGFAPNNLTAFSVKVYDRWGQLLYASTDMSFKWDGTVDGRPLTEGVYFWIVDAVSECGAGVDENGVVHIMKTPE